MSDYLFLVKMVKKRYAIEELLFYREFKMVHLTLSRYASIIAFGQENMTIPPQFGVG